MRGGFRDVSDPLVGSGVVAVISCRSNNWDQATKRKTAPIEEGNKTHFLLASDLQRGAGLYPGRKCPDARGLRIRP